MATKTLYTFTISPFDSDQFTALIQSSSIITALDHIDTLGSTVNVYFKDVLSSGDQSTLNGLVTNYVYSPPSKIPVNIDNVPVFEQTLRAGQSGYSNFTIVSHDFTDRTTWYQKSVPVTGETLTDSGNGLTFNSVNANWINMNSQKLTVDYKKVLERDGSLTAASMRYAVISVNGVVKTEGPDYTVNYQTGQVTFNSSQSGQTVTANYYHNNNVNQCSEFLFVPPPNYEYIIEHVEAQFSKNVDFNGSNIILEIWAGAVANVNGLPTVNVAAYDNFIGALFDAGYGQSRSTYRNLLDLLNWCTNSYPPIPACGTLTQDILCFPFLYTIHPSISSNQGTLIRLVLSQDVPLIAEICTVTLYMEKGPLT